MEELVRVHLHSTTYCKERPSVNHVKIINVL